MTDGLEAGLSSRSRVGSRKRSSRNPKPKRRNFDLPDDDDDEPIIGPGADKGDQ